VTDNEVHEMLSVLLHRYPQFPIETADQWVQSFALADPELAFNAVAVWCQRHATWPMIAEVHEMMFRMSEGLARGRAAMWRGYAAECEKLGREPSHPMFDREIATAS
jgi:hypothetical protein